MDENPAWSYLLPSVNPFVRRELDTAERLISNVEYEIEQFVYLEESDAKDRTKMEKLVKSAASGLKEMVDEAQDRLTMAEEFFSDVNDIAANLLQRMKAVLVPQENWDSVSEWLYENFATDDWNAFWIRKDRILVIYDENRRLEFKMRWL